MKGQLLAIDDRRLYLKSCSQKLMTGLRRRATGGFQGLKLRFFANQFKWVKNWLDG